MFPKIIAKKNRWFTKAIIWKMYSYAIQLIMSKV